MNNTRFSRMIIAAAVAMAIFACFYPYRRSALNAKKLRSGLWREIFLFLFVGAFGGIGILTLRPNIDWIDKNNRLWGDIVFRVGRTSWTTNTNFIPFQFLVKDSFWDLSSVLTGAIGNTLLFAPIGFCSGALFRKPKWWKPILIGGGFSVFIEASQYFIGRTTDVDDVILNTTGAVIGYLVFLLLRKIWPKFTNKLVCRDIGE